MGKSISRRLDFITGNDQFAVGDWQDLITILGGTAQAFAGQNWVNTL